MTVPPFDEARSIELVVTDIRALHAPIEHLGRQFREAIAHDPENQQPSAGGRSGRHWSRVAYTDSLARLRLFVEQNFNYVESIGLLALARYVFELTVWLKLMQRDSRYGIVYYRELISKQLNHYRDLRDHLTREVAFLREIDAHERMLLHARLKEGMELSDQEARRNTLSRLSIDVMREIDRAAARRFSLYGEQSRINGYGFQADLIETKVLPSVVQSIEEIEREQRLFDNNVPLDIKSLAKPWKWKPQARLVDMEHEYDFIYSYTSRLLHATPASLTTDQKNLEPREVLVFLRYVHVRLLEIIDMARQVPVAEPAHE
ncbi:MAG: hypothetical protein AAB225_24985 [Acidobacteriota bacterium]